MIGGNFWRNNKKGISVIVLFLLPLIPLYYDEFPLPKFHLYEKFNHFISEPISSLSSYTRHGASHLWNRYVALINADAENKNLKEQLDQAQKNLVNNSEFKKENKRLEKLLKLKTRVNFQTRSARIIGYDPQKEIHNFFINIGSNQGVQKNMPVVVPLGIVGTVEKVYLNSSLISSLLNPNHSVDGRIKRTRSRMIVEGLGESMLARLKYLDRAEDIRVGDTVLTSGLDPVFPKGLVVGSIVNIKRPKTGVTQNAQLRASVDIGKLEEVSVILKTPLNLESEGEAR